MRALAVGLILLLTVSIVGCDSSSDQQPAGKSSGESSKPAVEPKAKTGEAAVDISNFTFSPETAAVKVGTTVTWTNDDEAVHRVAADDGGFESTDLAKGEDYSHAFDKAGNYPYKCPIHPSMTGEVVVK